MERQEFVKVEKHYLEKDVYTSTIERIEYIFDNFEKVYFSVSGGKDSTVMFHLAMKVAKEKGKLPLNVLFIDLEAQYKATIKHVENILLKNPDLNVTWLCLPFGLRNGCSVFEPWYKCWDESKRDLWVRNMPTHKCVINKYNMPKDWDFFYEGMEFEEFVVKFGQWMSDNGNVLTACGVGIRADESLNRFLAIMKDSEESKFRGMNWTTKIKKNLYNFYPIYDWKTEDVWTCIGKYNLPYNKIYDLMYLAGRSIHDMRICEPYGDDQREGIDLFRKIEPETWEKVVMRVSGANYGNIYRGTKLLGNGKVIKPEGYTWKSYTEFLLDTIPKYQAHIYRERFEQFFKWFEDVAGIKKEDVPDAIPSKDNPIRKINKLNGEHLNDYPSWERLAKCILKNDLVCRSIGFGILIGGYPRIQRLKEKYGE